MQISEVNINLIKPKDGMIGFASIIIDSNVFLNSIGIHKKLNAEGYRITYPTKGSNQTFYPINREAGKAIEQAIFNKLNDVMNKVNDDRYNSYDYTRA